MMQEPCKKCGEYHNNCYEFFELTDEEILDEYRQCYGDEGTLTDCYFARQILQRAQEK